MKMLFKIEVKRLTEMYFGDAMKILDNELGLKRVRGAKFLHAKFKKFPQFFIGIFHDKELVGLICGFPRDDYLLMSEIAIDSRFHGRGYGEKLVREFEKKAHKYKKIHAGAEDNAIGFYTKMGYKPFLLIQVLKKDYKPSDYSNFDIKKVLEVNNQIIIEVKTKEVTKKTLENYRKIHPLAHFQFIFVKGLDKKP